MRPECYWLACASDKIPAKNFGAHYIFPVQTPCRGELFVVYLQVKLVTSRQLPMGLN